MPSRPTLLRGLLLIIPVLTIALVGLGWWAARRTLPALSGEMSLASLKTPVEVLFDAYAVPHVYARDEGDVFAAAGFLHGRERLWQMDLYRRAAGGRLSELFGESTLPLDRQFRRLGLRQAAVAEWARATPRVRTSLARYADGVNDAMNAAAGWRLPLEFLALRVTPEPWGPVDSLSISKLMAWRLGENHRGELVRGELVTKLGPAAAAALLGEPPSWAPTIIDRDSASPNAQVTMTDAEQDSRTRLANVESWRHRASATGGTPGLPRSRGVYRTDQSSETQDISGSGAQRFGPALDIPGLEWLRGDRAATSNSWVVAGLRTATGRPMLANDPHLAVEMPSIWYELHLVAAGLDVAGVTIPGLPYVLIGHNQKVGWGLTNAGADVQDLYLEQLDRERKRYLYNGAWLPIRSTRQSIQVYGRRDAATFDVLATPHGPVASDADWSGPSEAALASARRGEPERTLALRFDTLALGENAGAFDAINRAGNWDEFLAAIRRFAAPAQNFIYADTSGNIGYALAGLVPVRTAGDGAAPVPGWTSRFEWQGFVPPADLPRVLNPSSGQIVSANNEIDRGFPRLITRDWVAPFRAARIIDVLADRRGLDRSDFSRLQADITSRAADWMLRSVEPAVARARARGADPAAVAVLDRLRLWNRQIDDSTTTTLYEAFEAALWRRTFADEMEPRLFRQFYEYASSERFAGLYAIIDEPESPWFDDIATVDRRETRDDIILLAASDALASLRGQFGDETSWSWSRLHATGFTHPLGRSSLPMAWWFSRGPVPVEGDDMTVSKTLIDRLHPYATVEVASYRQILDVGDWDQSIGVNTTGQSGHAMSAHYFDQNPLWRDGRYHPLPYTRRSVDAAKTSHLWLVPASGEHP